MTIYVSWAGVEMLNHVPLRRLPYTPPKEVSIRITPNAHTVIIVDPSGVIWFNDVFAAMYDEGKPKTIIDETFTGHNQQIIGIVDYRVI